jgi:hypothetical protein
MHDFFLSYASVERARADEVRDRLVRAGRTVWIDAAEPSDREPTGGGIPAGQRHWEVIAEAIDQSCTFLVLYSADWMASDYCRKELDHAVAVGKRVVMTEFASSGTAEGAAAAFISTQDDTITDALAKLEAGDDVAAAQARLQADLTDTADDGRSTWFRSDASRARDAETLLTADRPSLGLTLTDDLSHFCQDVLAAARRFRQVLVASLMAVLLVIGSLTAIALIDRQSALLGRDRSASAESHARSLLLARQAVETTSTAQALRTARSAVQAEANLSSRSALSRIEATARYRQTLQLDQGRSLAAAVSDDGRSALVARPNGLLLVDVVLGSVKVLTSVDRLGQLAALSADGSVGVVTDSAARLLCVDTHQGTIISSAADQVVDVKIQQDGTTWWMSTSGDLYKSHGCPTSGPAPLVRAGAALGFELSRDSTRVFVLTSDVAVDTYDVPAIAGTNEPARVAHLSLIGLPVKGGFNKVIGPDPRVPSSVTRCGTQIHVLTGVLGRTTLPTSAHASIDLDGALSTHLSQNLQMTGSGCGPDDDAWAAPALGSSPLQLPDSGHYPPGIIDERDRPGWAIVGNSVGRTTEIVAHPDGRIDILVRAALPWGRLGDRAVTIPLSDGQVLASQDGQIIWRDAEGRERPIGALGGPPGFNTTGTRQRAYLTAGSVVVEVGHGRVLRTFNMPGPVETLSSSAPDDDVVVGGDGWWRHLRGTAETPPEVLLPPSGLDSGERVLFMHADGDRLLETTNYGRILLADSNGEIKAEVAARVAGPTAAAFLADHSVVAITADGMLRSFSPDLRPLRSTLIGSGGIKLDVSASGTAMVVGLGDFSVWVVDPATLEPQQRIAIETPDVRRIWLSPDGSFLQRTFSTGEGAMIAAERIPLNGPD